MICRHLQCVTPGCNACVHPFALSQHGSNRPLDTQPFLLPVRRADHTVRGSRRDSEGEDRALRWRLRHVRGRRAPRRSSNGTYRTSCSDTTHCSFRSSGAATPPSPHSRTPNPGAASSGGCTTRATLPVSWPRDPSILAARFLTYTPFSDIYQRRTAYSLDIAGPWTQINTSSPPTTHHHVILYHIIISSRGPVIATTSNTCRAVPHTRTTTA